MAQQLAYAVPNSGPRQKLYGAHYANVGAPIEPGIYVTDSLVLAVGAGESGTVVQLETHRGPEWFRVEDVRANAITWDAIRRAARSLPTAVLA